MGTIITSLLIGTSLSMDAFSLSLIYGTLNLNLRQKILLSIIVGIFHFFMPLLGVKFGNIIINNIFLDANYLVAIIFFVIGIEMIISNKKEEETKYLINIISFIFFGFTVSIDSFSTGIGLKVISNNILLSVIIFFITSMSFTYFGLSLGNKIGIKTGKNSVVIGGIVLTLFAIYYLTKA